MTKEQRAQSRAICEAASCGAWHNGKYSVNNPTGIPICCQFTNDYDKRFIAHARTALPAALDYIEQLEREVKIALKTCPNGGNDGYITPRPCQCEVESIEADRDHWKARAEALERAIKKHDAPCDTCKTFYSEDLCYAECDLTNQYNGWLFDQSRFSDKPTPCQEGE